MWRTSMRSLIAAMPVLVFLGAHPSAAQSQECEDTPEGRVCRVQQPIAAGAVVDEQTQRSLGLSASTTAVQARF